MKTSAHNTDFVLNTINDLLMSKFEINVINYTCAKLPHFIKLNSSWWT